MLSRLVQELLRKEPVYCAVVNKHSEPNASQFLVKLGCKPIADIPLQCYVAGLGMVDTRIPPSPQNKEKLLYYYAMDIASLLPVLALEPKVDDTVLDMCAAPGGKAFALLQMLSLTGGLALNDSSRKRLTRLKDVTTKCVPKDLRRAIRFTLRKGEEWANIELRTYDCVLVDAPCSSERHHIDDWAASGKWYPHSETYSVLQQKLLLAALHAAKLGGMVVYSTCTLAERENDSVISRTLGIASDMGMKVQPIEVTKVTKMLDYCSVTTTEFGKLIYPDLHKNCGPMYVSKLQVCG